MNLVLLSGGSGKRLWPLSNDVRSKQFIKIFKNEKNEYESMVQRIFRQIKSVNNNAKVLITTSKKQVSSIRNHLGNSVDICVEPSRRDTFPAIALAAAYLKYECSIKECEAVVVCPVDPYVEVEYFAAIEKLSALAESGEANLSLMGIEPTYPSEKYGYILPESNCEVSKVKLFKEKPSSNKAREYISEGALWNGGVFAFRLGYILDIARKYVEFSSYRDLYKKYDELPKISFDYAVVEKESEINVMRFSGKWSDLGTWNTLTEVMESQSIGQVILNENCKNVHVINELNIPILCMGLNNAVISASPEGILVSDKNESSYIKPYVDNIEQQVMFAEKSWGSFCVLDAEKENLTIKVTLNKGNKMNYHSHKFRDESWTVISGNGIAVINDKKIELKPGCTVKMPANSKHTVMALTDLKIIEVQTGTEISVDDKMKFDIQENLWS